MSWLLGLGFRVQSVNLEFRGIRSIAMDCCPEPSTNEDAWKSVEFNGFHIIRRHVGSIDYYPG